MISERLSQTQIISEAERVLECCIDGSDIWQPTQRGINLARQNSRKIVGHHDRVEPDSGEPWEFRSQKLATVGECVMPVLILWANRSLRDFAPAAANHPGQNTTLAGDLRGHNRARAHRACP